MTSTIPYRLGWKRDLVDPRDADFLFIPQHSVETLPSSVDLTTKCPPVYDQLSLGACTAHAIAAAFEFDVMRQDLADFMPSRLFIYYYERLAEGTVNEDSGAAIRDGIKVVNKLGVCPESMWPYNIARFTEMPPIQCSIEAFKERAVKYQKVMQDLTFMKSCLASGLPFVFGIDVYQSFMDAPNGDVPMFPQNEQSIGGHALLCVGYDDATQRFIFRNSWSEQWGNKGYGTIPYAYLVSAHASDFWQISVVGSVLSQLLDGFERFLGVPGD